jgi:hypothetical protein
MKPDPTIQITPSEQVVLKYSKCQPDGSDKYDDALIFSPEQYKAQTPESISAEIERRYANWLTVIHTPRPEPTAEQRAERIEQMKAERDRLTDQIMRELPDDKAKEAFLDEREEKLTADQQAFIPLVKFAEDVKA